MYNIGRELNVYHSVFKYVGFCIIIFQLQLKVILLSESSTVTHKSLTNRKIYIYTIELRTKFFLIANYELSTFFLIVYI